MFIFKLFSDFVCSLLGKLGTQIQFVMMAGPSNDKCSSSVVCSEDPPPLSITLKKTRDLPRKTTDWSIDHLPVDILLLTVEDCGFLACYYYLRNPFKSYEKSIGFVYFGKMGELRGRWVTESCPSEVF